MDEPSRVSNREFLRLLADADADKALALSTKSKYKSSLAVYLRFCIQFKLPATPTVETLCSFISFSCRRVSERTGELVSPRTVSAYLSGIAAAFEKSVPTVREVTNSKEVRKVLRGCMKEFSKPVKRKDALSLADLKLVAWSFKSSYDDSLFVVRTLAGFFALHRLGEITVPDVSELRDERRVIKRESVEFSACGTFLRYVLPYSKTDQFFLGTTIVLASAPNPLICPIRAMKFYLQTRDVVFPQATQLFLSSRGSSPTRKWFLDRFHSIFPKSKSGHSMRSGGATAMAQAGLPLSYIQDIGRWSSEAFKVYVRDHPLLRIPVQQQFAVALDDLSQNQVVFG